MDLRGVPLTNINCYSCAIPVIYIKSRTLQLGNSVTYSGLSDNAYTLGLKSNAPFFSLIIRKPYGQTETISMSGLTVTKSYGGVGGRFMDISWESITG